MPKVAAIQMESSLLDPDSNLEAILAHLHSAAQEGAALAVFPETIVPGYNMSREEAARVAEPIPGPATDRLGEACRQEGICAVVGMIEAGPGSDLFNSAVLIGPDGPLERYRKTHLPLLGVDRYLSPGQAFAAPTGTSAGRVGILICYDLRFPEPIRCLALAGAQIVALPTAWPQAATLYPEYMARSRASENRVYLVAANHVGRERGTRYLGRSIIVAPSGEVLAQADSESETILLAEVDPSESDQKHLVFRPGEYELDLMKDRRPELYLPLTKGSGG
jgi:predicted amidohydrolase